MRESYCGLCEDCQLGNPGLLETVAQLKYYLDQVRANVWIHCFPGPEGFDLSEFRRGLDWFLAHTECPGCKGGAGVCDCPIKVCAQARHLEHCYECPDLEPCDKYTLLLEQFPYVKVNLLRRQLKFKAREYHRKLEGQKK
jgi:hypothetical protein